MFDDCSLLPPLHFIGFVSTRKCTLSNTSLVPVTYYLHMSNDGRVPSVRSRSPSPAKRTGSVAISAAATPVKPKEFEITPSSGLLQPQSEVEISVEICANTVRKYNTELCVDVEAVQDSLLLLPVTARWLHNSVLTAAATSTCCVDDDETYYSNSRPFFASKSFGLWGFLPFSDKRFLKIILITLQWFGSKWNLTWAVWLECECLHTVHGHQHEAVQWLFSSSY